MPFQNSFRERVSHACSSLLLSLAFLVFFPRKKVETVLLVPCLQRSGSSPWVSNSGKTISWLSAACSLSSRRYSSLQQSSWVCTSDFATEPPTMAWWPLIWWKGAKYTLPLNRSLWHMGYFELVLFKKQQTQVKLGNLSRSYPFVGDIYISKGNVHFKNTSLFLGLPWWLRW